MEESDNRTSVPLLMLQENIDVLLENKIMVESISLSRFGPMGVVLTIQMSPEQKVAAKALGFRTTKLSTLE